MQVKQMALNIGASCVPILIGAIAEYCQQLETQMSCKAV